MPPGACGGAYHTDRHPGTRQAPKQELHFHFHGVTAEDVAAILARHRRGTWI